MKKVHVNVVDSLELATKFGDQETFVGAGPSGKVCPINDTFATAKIQAKDV